MQACKRAFHQSKCRCFNSSRCSLRAMRPEREVARASSKEKDTELADTPQDGAGVASSQHICGMFVCLDRRMPDIEGGRAICLARTLTLELPSQSVSQSKAREPPCSGCRARPSGCPCRGVQLGTAGSRCGGQPADLPRSHCFLRRRCQPRRRLRFAALRARSAARGGPDGALQVLCWARDR